MPPELFLWVGGLFGCGAVLLLLGQLLHRTVPIARRADWIKYGVYVLLIHLLLVSAMIGRALVAAILVSIAAAGTLELIRVSHGLVRGARAAFFSLLLLATLGHLLLGSADQWRSRFAASVLLVAVTDSFGQLWGRLFGRHQLCPRLSPAKTIEGLAGGLGTAVAVSIAYRSLDPTLHPGSRTVLGLVTAAGAVAGDLAFSRIKRICGVKDFSRLLPGHGGVLDRFDSLIMAAPVCFWARTVLERFRGAW